MSECESVRLRLLGPLDITSAEGRPLTELVVQPKRLALFVFLVLAGPERFCRRDALLPLFWPEADEGHARNALSRAIYVLRGVLGDAVILNRGSGEVGVAKGLVNCDALDFRTAVAAGDWESAVEIYRGHLMEGFHLRGAGSFGHWLEDTRSDFHRMFVRASRIVAGAAEARGETDRAETVWRLLLSQVPGRTEAVLGVMRALEAGGDRIQALEEARRHAAFLRTEFDVDPEPEVSELAAAIRARAAASSPRPTPISAGPAPG